jgi:dihydrofolate reductase
MRKLIVTEFMALDGVVENPSWTFEVVEFDEAAYDIKAREQEEASALLLGRVSHDEFAPVWPSMEQFERYNSLPKYVVSSTLQDSDWENTHVLRSLDDVAALKERTDEGDGPIYVHASARLSQGLLAAGLVDRLHLMLFPVVMGSGKRLFAQDGPRVDLTLVEHRTFANGVSVQVLDVRH